MKRSNKAWFGTTPASYGASVPIRWQGWAALAIHGALIAACVLPLHRRPLLGTVIALLLAVLPLPLYAAKTRRPPER